MKERLVGAARGANGRRMWLLDVPFDDRTDAKWAGARWHAALKRWVVWADAVPEALSRFAPPPFSWEAWLQDELDAAGGWTHSDDNSSTIALRPHQQQAALALAEAHQSGDPGFLIADQVGLGKTYAAISGVNEINSGLNILVLCPLSVTAHWRRSIQAAGAGGNRWCVLNYDRAKALLEEPQSAVNAKRTRTKNKRIAQQGRSLVGWDVIIADESHRLKNPQSQRSAAVRQLIKAHGTSAFVVWMSATAGQTPLELSYLAPLLAGRTGSTLEDLDDFELWCRHMGIGVRRGSFGSWVWERNERDLTMMNELLFGGETPVGIRRRPEDIQGWPSMQRVMWATELNWAQRQSYEAAWEEFRRELKLSPSGSDPHNALVAALRFRQKASLLRVEATARFALDMVEDGYQVAISVQFLETARAIADALGSVKSVLITGENPASEREQARISFQQGNSAVCIFTVTEGISLHAGEQAVSATETERVLLAHDIRWSALDMAQIEGRAHRDGKNAVGYYMFAEDTKEQSVVEAVLKRLTDMGTMLGDDTVGLDALLAQAQR